MGKVGRDGWVYVGVEVEVGEEAAMSERAEHVVAVIVIEEVAEGMGIACVGCRGFWDAEG